MQKKIINVPLVNQRKPVVIPAKENQNTNIFQAIGVIKGEVIFQIQEDNKEPQPVVKLGLKCYPLIAKDTRSIKVLLALKKIIKDSGSDHKVFRLLVYPFVVHYPDRNQHHLVGFQVIAWETDDASQNNNLFRELKDFEFKISGVWHYIAVCKVPCISVYRNCHRETPEILEDLDDFAKLKYMRANHLPIFWKNTPYTAYRFNPNDTESKAIFLSIKAKFLPWHNVWGFESLLALPNSDYPSHLKPSKMLKQKVMRLKRER